MARLQLNTLLRATQISSYAICVFLFGLTGHSFGEQPKFASVQAKIRSGDASVIPVLRQWLRADMAVEGPANTILALEGIAAFRDPTSEKVVSDFYQVAPPGSELRRAAAAALAEIGTKTSVTDLRKIVWDPELPLTTRCNAAATLLKCGDTSGGTFLLIQYDLYKLERTMTNRWHLDPVRDTLERLDDPALLSGLQERLNKERGEMGINIRTLIDRMEVNSLPVAKLKDMAGNPSWSERTKRYWAIQTLGYKGSLDCIALLEALQPWQDAKPIEERQQSNLRDAAKKAIIEIRRHNWNTAAHP